MAVFSLLWFTRVVSWKQIKRRKIICLEISDCSEYSRGLYSAACRISWQVSCVRQWCASVGKSDIVLTHAPNKSFFFFFFSSLLNAASAMPCAVRKALKKKKKALWNKQMRVFVCMHVFSPHFLHFNPILSAWQLEMCHYEFFFFFLIYDMSWQDSAFFFFNTCALSFTCQRQIGTSIKFHLTADTWLEINIWC